MTCFLQISQAIPRFVSYNQSKRTLDCGAFWTDKFLSNCIKLMWIRLNLEVIRPLLDQFHDSSKQLKNVYGFIS